MTIFNYTVNYVDVSFCIIFLVFMIAGWSKGLFVSILNFIRYVFGFALCFYCSGNLTQPVYDKYVKANALSIIEKNIVTSSNIDEVTSNIKDFSSSMPKIFENTFDMSFIDRVSSKNLSNYILDSFFEPVLLAVIKILIFIVVFLLFFVSTAVIVRLIDKRNKKKDTPLKKFDKCCGALLGLFKSFVLVLAITSILMYILSLRENIGLSERFVYELQNSSLLELMNKINPFNVITRGIL